MLGDEALVWDERSADLHHLSAAATAVWHAYSRNPDVASVQHAVAAAGRATSPRHEVEVCIADLAAAGLLASQDSLVRGEISDAP